jgi:signal transduction histidine kinase
VRVITSSRRYGGRLGAEIARAFVVGVAAFALAALLSAAARSHVPGALLGLVLLLAVAVVAHYGGSLYALPVGVVSVQAFDWYFLPPLRALDAATVFVLGLFLVVSVLVGAVTTLAARRAQAAEEARVVLAGEQAALRRVATLVASQPSAEQVFATVTEEVGRLLRVDLTQLLVYEGDGTATAVAGWGARGARTWVGTRLTLEGNNVAALALRTQRPARMDNFANAEGFIAERIRALGIRSVVGTPVLVEGKLWGVMLAGSVQPVPLPATTESRMAGFTELVATAISNADARAELEHFVAQQAALRRVAMLVAGGVAPADVFAAIAEEVADLFGIQLVSLVRYEPDRTATTVAASGDYSAYVGRNWSFPPDDLSIHASVLRTGQPVRTDDLTGAEGHLGELIRELGVGSGIGVPIVVDGRVWGGVIVGVQHDRPVLPADTVDRLKAFMELAATAISNTTARNDLARLAEEQAGLRRVATLVARGVPPRDIFAAVAYEITRVSDVEIGFVMRFEPDATATVVATYGLLDEILPVDTNWALDGDSVTERVVRTGLTARIEGHQVSGSIAGTLPEHEPFSSAGAPIFIDDRAWGVAVATSVRPGGLPVDAEERIANFAELIATAIAKAEYGAELTASRARVVVAADDARRQVERDLHDGIQQRLVSLALEVRSAESMSPQHSDELRGQLSTIREGLLGALDDLREVSRGIHPAILSEGGLEHALKALARRSAVPIALDVNVDARLDEHVEVAAYYVASEALSNAAKHAQASFVELHVSRRDGGLVLSIRDDGIGGADPSRGSGLIGLTDRVEALGGTISVVSPAGEGTSLQVEIPASR